MLDLPCLVRCPVFITFHGINSKQRVFSNDCFKGKCFVSLCVCVSMALTRTDINTKRSHCNRNIPAAVRNLSQQLVSASEGPVCWENCTCCHTETQLATQTGCSNQSEYTDTGQTSPSADPLTPAWTGTHIQGKGGKGRRNQSEVFRSDHVGSSDGICSGASLQNMEVPSVISLSRDNQGLLIPEA